VSPNIPRSGVVNSAFRVLQNRLDGVQKRINAAAAQEMKIGKYDDAQEWMGVGRSVAEFAQRVEAFAQEWKRLVKTARLVVRPTKVPLVETGTLQANSTRTPVWKFCEPALKILAGRGGTATLGEILSDLQSLLAGRLTDSDQTLVGKNGIPRWHNDVQRAYRQCQREGWIEQEKRRDGVWRITAKGRAIAEMKAQTS
jgi:hypothetical protein